MGTTGLESQVPVKGKGVKGIISVAASDEEQIVNACVACSRLTTGSGPGGTPKEMCSLDDMVIGAPERTTCASFISKGKMGR